MARSWRAAAGGIGGAAMLLLLNACGAPSPSTGSSSGASTRPAATGGAQALVTGTPAITFEPPVASAIPSVTATSTGTMTPSASAATHVAPPARTATPPAATPPPVPHRTPTPPPPAPPPTAPPAAACATITAVNFSFTEDRSSITHGCSVLIEIKDGGVHTFTLDNGSFSFGPLSRDGSTTHVFTAPGTFAYHCSVHAYMTGSITVT